MSTSGESAATEPEEPAYMYDAMDEAEAPCNYEAADELEAHHEPPEDHAVAATDEMKPADMVLGEAKAAGETACEAKPTRDAAAAMSMTGPAEPFLQLSEQNLALYKTALNDIATGRMSSQLPKGADGATEAALRERADQLLRHLGSNGLMPSAMAAAELQSIVNKYCGLINWLRPEETLANKTLDIEFRTHNGKTHQIACNLNGRVQDLQDAIGARLGGCSVAGQLQRQLLCHGQPMNNASQGLYDWCALHGLGLRRGVAVQEVVRANSG